MEDALKISERTREFLRVLCGALKCLLGAGVVLGVTPGMALQVVATIRVLEALAYQSWLNTCEA
jgi:hypothetical protein